MQSETAPLLTGLLKEVSRSFYLTLRILPATIRPQIGLAYLLARATDTVADTELVPVARRLQSLESLRARILGQTTAPLDLCCLRPPNDSPTLPGNPAEWTLLRRIEEILALLSSFQPDDQASIREVIHTITGGQALDLQRFAQARAHHLVALASAAELDDYTYRVAGCVGEFWTTLCRRHVFPKAPLQESLFLEQGIRFGKGLQLVNILRDLPADLRQGRCYLPRTQLQAIGLNPDQLLDPGCESRLRPLYTQWLDLAQGHLEAGWAYTCQIPHSCLRLRLACAWPILIGIQTLARLRREPVLDPSRRVKVTRQQVRSILARSILLLPFTKPWHSQFQRLAQEPFQG